MTTTNGDRRLISWMHSCGRKKQYETEKSANRRGRKDEKEFGEKMRAYLCNNCGYWHLAKAIPVEELN